MAKLTEFYKTTKRLIDGLGCDAGMVIERYPGKPIIASEFARMGDDPMSDKQAAAAIGVGAWGTGT